MKPDALVKMSCIANTWKDFWVSSLKSPNVFDRAQKIALSPDNYEKSPDDMEFSKSFHLDEKLN